MSRKQQHSKQPANTPMTPYHDMQSTKRCNHTGRSSGSWTSGSSEVMVRLKKGSAVDVILKADAIITAFKNDKNTANCMLNVPVFVFVCLHECF